MSADHLIDDDEQYASSEDSDFAPDGLDTADRESLDSDSNAEVDRGAAKKRKRDAAENVADDVDLDNSGDETVIKKGEKRRKKKERGKAEDVEDGEEGIVIKTRSMRAAEKAERKFAASTGPVTIDVDALWEQMKSGSSIEPAPPQAESTSKDSGVNPQGVPGLDTVGDASSNLTIDASLDPPDMIRIKRKYNFAGRVHTEEKLVPRDSAEAKLYLESQAGVPLPDDDPSAPTRKVPRKAFRSAFEPVLEPLQRRGDLNLGVTARLEARDARAKKLNTVEKSRMDWAGFVDKEGIKDELELAGRSKGSYAERQDFLARSEARREEDARRARVTAR